MNQVNLSDIITLQKGKKPKEIKSACSDSFFPYVDIKAFETGKIDKFTDGEKCVKCEDNDLLIVCDGSRSGLIGKAVKGFVGSTLARIDCDLSVDKDYLYYFIQSKYKLLNSNVKGTGTPHLKQELLKSFRLYLPSIERQKQIVKQIEESLSQLDNAVETLNKTKQQLEIYRQAVIKEAFDRVSLDDYNSFKTVIVGTPQNGLYKPKSDYGTGTCILRIDGFYDGRILDDYDYKRVRLDDNELVKYSLQVNDLVINRVNSMQYLGKCALVRTLAENTIFESNMMRIKLNPSLVDYEYIIYYLSSVQGKKELTKNAKQAVNQASINQTDVCNTIVPLPDVSVQRELRNSIDIALSIYKDIGSAIHQSLQQSEALRQSILKQAFEGNDGKEL